MWEKPDELQRGAGNKPNERQELFSTPLDRISLHGMEEGVGRGRKDKHWNQLDAFMAVLNLIHN